MIQGFQEIPDQLFELAQKKALLQPNAGGLLRKKRAPSPIYSQDTRARLGQLSTPTRLGQQS